MDIQNTNQTIEIINAIAPYIIAILGILSPHFKKSIELSKQQSNKLLEKRHESYGNMNLKIIYFIDEVKYFINKIKNNNISENMNIEESMNTIEDRKQKFNNEVKEFLNEFNRNIHISQSVENIFGIFSQILKYQFNEIKNIVHSDNDIQSNKKLDEIFKDLQELSDCLRCTMKCDIGEKASCRICLKPYNKIYDKYKKNQP